MKTAYIIIFLALLIFFYGSIAVAQTESILDEEMDYLPPVESSITPLKGSDILYNVGLRQKTHPEHIIMTSYKLAAQQPDFDHFAKLSPVVAQASDIDKSIMILSEYNRLERNFNLSEPNEPIVIHTYLKTEQYSSLQDIMVFDEIDKKTIFKYKSYDENIALVPENIEKFHKIHLGKEQATHFFDNLNGADYVLAEFILVPKYSDRQEPFIFNDTSYWLMFNRVAELRLWSPNSDENKLLWYYKADWYQPNDSQDIDELFSMN